MLPTRFFRLVGLFILFATLSVACSGQAATTSPADAPAIDREEVQALIEAAITESPNIPGDEISREEISREELREIMGEVMAEASPTSSQEDLSELVSASVIEELGTRPDPISKADVEVLIQAAIRPLQGALGVTPGPTVEGGNTTIVFSDLDWDSARLQNRIAMFIVEHGYGYPVDLVSGETQRLWDDLLVGDSLVTMEVWLPNQQEAWDRAIVEGGVIPLGKSLDENWQGWIVPTYLTNRRSLKTVQHINDEDHIDLFVASGKEFERPKKAAFVTCPSGTACHDINLAKLKAYALEADVDVIVPDSFSALQESLKRAYVENRPWLGYMWGPSPASEELDLTVLAEPIYTEECWTVTKGCAYPTSTVLIAVHPSLLNIAPDVVDFLRNWDFRSRIQTMSEKWMDVNDATLEETAIHFLQTWPQVWTEWVPDDVTLKVQTAIARENAP